MPKITADTIQAAAGIDPLNLAILLIGVISLAAIWLAAVAIRASVRGKKDE